MCQHLHILAAGKQAAPAAPAINATKSRGIIQLHVVYALQLQARLHPTAGYQVFQVLCSPPLHRPCKSSYSYS